jgi:hypothetical protein
MPIQSDDIKLLKSAVMADVPEGGGPATGVEIVDGASNNVFPDVSTDDRAAGRFRLRKVFGAAHTDDADLLLGASFVVLEPPADPLVHLTLLQTPGWFDTRTTAKTAIEAYLVKGSKLLCRVQDRHFAGALILQLYNTAPATGFPTAGDTVVLVNPNGSEQYVRVLKTTLSQQQLQVTDNDLITVNLCTCELDKVLAFDLLGQPIQKAQPGTNAAVVYATALSTGVQFHGVKRLGAPAAVGDRSVLLDGGIFSPVVPANTIEEPLTDIFPLVQRPTLSRTAFSALTLPATTLTLTAGTVLLLPLELEPGTLTMTHGATAFSSNLDGELLQGSTVVGAVDARARTVTLSGAAPNYGSASNTITFRPATVTGATAHSAAIEVTTPNQGLGWVYAFEPTPAPGTLSVSYLAQGRWYELTEDGTGKLSGADSAYGVGTLNFLSGSLALTLGALPDVGSAIVFTWGEADSARQADSVPARLWTTIALTQQPQPGTLVFTWPAGGSTLSASVAASGAVTGPAQVRPVRRLPGGTYEVDFSPNTLPTGPVGLDYIGLPETSAFTNDGGGQYTLAEPPREGSVRFNLVGNSGALSKVFPCHSVGTDVFSGETLVGQINNTTGVMLLNGAPSVSISTHVTSRVSAESFVRTS